AWDRAKAASDFTSFAPHLQRQLELKHRYVECFPEIETAYDVLLEDYEEGMTTTEVVRVFDRLKDELIAIVERCRGDSAEEEPLRGPFPVALQHAAGRHVERDPRVAKPHVGEPRRPQPRLLALVLSAAAGPLRGEARRSRRILLCPRSQRRPARPDSR